MPGSSLLGKDYIAGTLVPLLRGGQVRRVVDVGAGSGTYRLLLAEDGGAAHWTAVEIWEPYVERFALEQLYDEVFIGPARDFDFTAARPDLVLFGDVVEHVAKAEAQETVARAVAAAALVMISIPVGHSPQEEVEGNPFERHVKDDWSHQEVIASFDHVVTAAVHGFIGVYFLSADPAMAAAVKAAHLQAAMGLRMRPDLYPGFHASDVT